MVAFFRTLVVTAIVLLLAAAVLPLDHPVHFKISLDQTLPLWLVASGAILLIVLVALVASGGLFFFKPWGRWLGLLVAIAGAMVALTGSATFTSLSSAAATLLVFSASLWVIGLFVSYHPAVSVKFQHAR